MHVQPSLTETTKSHCSRGAEGTRWHGHQLVLASVVWVAVVVFTLSIFMLSLPAYFAQLQTVCAGDTCVYPVGLLLIPLSLGVATLRYRLWNIDILISRTLVYGTLTGFLALVYVGLVIALQALFKAITGQVGASPVVIASSTLAIARLFQPLRHHIQRIIDRRFYRHKYDAVRTLAAFSATLRSEVDLSQLSKQLVAVVQETMQPASVSLWLRPPGQERRSGSNQLSPLNGVPGKEEAWGDIA